MPKQGPKPFRLSISKVIGCVFLFSSLLLLISSCVVSSKIADKQVSGFTITIDLCPSSKKYEARLFKYLDSLGKKMGKPVPVAVAVSGRWIEHHSKELAEIKKMYLDVTWVNHSYSHPVGDDFLNNPKVDFKHEVLGNVALMEKHHLKVSKYFRFPGLRHNAGRLKELKALGYINLDADAWLGKGQKIKEGSIVLIHGNGNERPGIVKSFIKYLSSREKDLVQGRLQIVPLSDNKLGI